MQKGLDREGWPRWATLLAFAAVAFPLNLVLAIVTIRITVMRGIDREEIQDALGDIGSTSGEFAGLPLALLRNGFRDEVWWLVVAFAFVLTQVVFLAPWVGPRPKVGNGPGWPLWFSAVSAGLVAALVAAGLMYGLGEGLGQVAMRVLPVWPEPEATIELIQRSTDADDWIVALPLFALLPLWILTGTLLLRITSPADPMRPEIQLRRLLAGSMASIVLVIPFDALARRKTDCYCATGTWWSLCVGFLALIWIAGPTAVLLLNRRRRLALRREACLECGYSRRGQAGSRCVECGTEFPEATRIGA